MSSDLVVASTADVTFRASRRRAFLMMFCVAGAAWFLTRAACMVLIGGVGVRPTSADLLSLVVTTLGYATSVGAAFVLVTWRRRPWVRVSTAGLELSATGRGVVLVPWSQVDAVALHGYGPSTRLVVTPTEDFATTTGTTAVVVDVATVRPSAATLLSEIDHAATRGAERPQAA